MYPASFSGKRTLRTKTLRVRKRPEQALQQDVANFLAAVLGPQTFFTAIPMGPRGAGRVGLMRGALWKGMGAKPGVPDLVIIWDGRCFFIELKAEKGKVSQVQRECHQLLSDAGCEIAVARSIEDVMECLEVWQIPTRIVDNG